MKKRWSIVLSLVLCSFACGAPDDLPAESLEQAATVTLRGSVPVPDTQCNSKPIPGDYVIAPGRTETVGLTVPSGWQISNWRCVNEFCEKSFKGQETAYEERLVLTHAGDPAHTSGAIITIFPAPPIGQGDGIRCPPGHVGKATKPPCWAYWYKPACCTCPCDANPGCQ